MKKVVKFGGSSLASAEQFKKVEKIIRSDETRVYVVPSAPGKRNSDDIKVTDMLYKCCELAGSGVDFTDDFQIIKDRYNGIISELGIDMSLEDEFGMELPDDALAEMSTVGDLVRYIEEN